MSTTAQAPVFVAGALLTAAQLNAISAIENGITAPWTSYSPTMSASGGGLVIGSGGATAARYIQIGKTVICQGQLQFGTGASAGSGNYTMNIPVSANITVPNGIIGSMGINPNAGALWGQCIPFLQSPTGVIFWGPTSTTSAMSGQIGSTGVGGIVYTTSAIFRWNYAYEAA